jgi:AraC family transcriptional regulator
VRWQVTGEANGRSHRTEHQLFVTLSGSLRRTKAWVDGGHRYDGADFAGATTLIPSGLERRARYGPGTIEYASIRLDTGLLSSLEGAATERLELVPFTNRPDPMTHRLAVALCDEARERGASSTLFVDSVATTLLLHLVRTSSNLEPRRMPKQAKRSTLPAPTLRRVLDYVDAHLGEDLRLDALAGHAGMDRTTFGRAFKAAVGTTPHQYVLRRRLEVAAELMRAADAPPIAEIAYRVGMSSQSHLTTAFRRHYNATPHAYRAAHFSQRTLRI